MKDYNTLETRSSELCLLVQSDPASAQAAHTSISPLLCDNPQAEPRTLPTHPTTRCPHPSPFYAHLLRRQALPTRIKIKLLLSSTGIPALVGMYLCI